MEFLHQILQNSSFVDSFKTVHSTASGERTAYQQLFESWDGIKKLLLDNNLNGQKRIGFLMSAKPKSLQCIGAILLSENVYIPLDYQAPISRNKHIIQDNCMHALLIDQEVYELYKDQLPKHTLSTFNEVNLICFLAVENVPNIPTYLAYILNTSGSTGKPKGVMITHQNALSFINWAGNILELSGDDIFASIAPFHFDLSIFDLYVSLNHGGSLVFFEPDHIKNPLLLSHLIAKEKITVIYGTPTVLRLILQYGKLHKYDHSSLRYVLFAGEVFPIEDLKKLQEKWPHVTFYNWYGPTETNVCTYHKIPKEIVDKKTPFPIGRECIPNTTKVAADGELLVSGALVTPGYWNNPKKNAASFVEDESGRQWYCTGDLVQIDESNDYVFMGRKDRMIKRRGYRIELDEIEHLLRGHPLIQDAAVISTKNKKDQLLICCYYNLVESKQDASSIDFRDYLLQSIPLYMLPDQYYLIEGLPKTSTHKIDYQALISSAKYRF